MTSTETPARTVEFVVGQDYAVRSLGDWDCIFRFTVTARTAKFVTLVTTGDETMRVGVTTWDGVERCQPFGRYSMAPTLSADRPAA